MSAMWINLTRPDDGLFRSHRRITEWPGGERQFLHRRVGLFSQNVKKDGVGGRQAGGVGESLKFYGVAA